MVYLYVNVYHMYVTKEQICDLLLKEGVIVTLNNVRVLDLVIELYCFAQARANQ